MEYPVDYVTFMSVFNDNLELFVGNELKDYKDQISELKDQLLMEVNKNIELRKQLSLYTGNVEVNRIMGR